MVNSLCVHQGEVNENKDNKEQITSVQSLVHSSHADLFKYGHVTTQSVTSCSEGNDD